VPGEFVDHPKGYPVFGIGSGIAVLDKQLTPLEVREKPGPENLVHFWLDWAVHLPPPDLLFGGGFLHHETVVGGPARILSGKCHQRTQVCKKPFLPPHRVLVEGRGRLVPPNVRGIPDAMVAQRVYAIRPAMLLHRRRLLIDRIVYGSRPGNLWGHAEKRTPGTRVTKPAHPEYWTEGPATLRFRFAIEYRMGHTT
jgi:hypothetical protein